MDNAREGVGGGRGTGEKCESDATVADSPRMVLAMLHLDLASEWHRRDLCV